jgi:DNA-directed RNA polymerase specialized sigma24 family protein
VHVTQGCRPGARYARSKLVAAQDAAEERVVLHRAYAVGHSRQDIADIMNISCESVDTLLGAARVATHGDIL